MPAVLNLTRRWTPVVLWMAGIFYFSSRSAPLGALSSRSRGPVGKVAHMVEYAVLAILLYRAVADNKEGQRPSRSHNPSGPSSNDNPARTTANGRHSPIGGPSVLYNPTFVAFFVALAYAVFDEFHQQFTPGRAFEFADLGYDVAGVIAALGLFWMEKRWMRRRGAGERG